jgi:hypothetical protein
MGTVSHHNPTSGPPYLSLQFDVYSSWGSTTLDYPATVESSRDLVLICIFSSIFQDLLDLMTQPRTLLLGQRQLFYILDLFEFKSRL